MTSYECSDVFIGLNPNVQYRTDTGAVKEALRTHFSSYEGNIKGFFKSENEGGGLDLKIDGNEIGFDFRSDEERESFAEHVKAEEWSKVFQLDESYERSWFKRTYPSDVAIKAMEEYNECKKLARMGLMARVIGRTQDDTALRARISFSDIFGGRELTIRELSITLGLDAGEDDQIKIVNKDDYEGQVLDGHGTEFIILRSSNEVSGVVTARLEWYENKKKRKFVQPILIPGFRETTPNYVSHVDDAISATHRCCSEVLYAAQTRGVVHPSTDARSDLRRHIRGLLGAGLGSAPSVLGKRFADLQNVFDVMGNVTLPSDQKTRGGNAALSKVLAQFHPEDLESPDGSMQRAFSRTIELSKLAEQFGETLLSSLKDAGDTIHAGEKGRLKAVLHQMEVV